MNIHASSKAVTYKQPGIVIACVTQCTCVWLYQ